MTTVDSVRLVVLVIFLSGLPGRASGNPVEVPRGIDHAPYERLLQQYVNDRGLVNYRAWNAAAEDVQALHQYTATFAGGGPRAEGDEKAASLINAYNALTLRWILDNYPVQSIKATANPWGAKRHAVGSRFVSLDEIEHDTLRPQVGYRAHAVLVCAARSCPPLWNHAYQADALEGQLDGALRRWLARQDLNQFRPDRQRVELSRIFRWYGKDFEQAAGGLRAVLRRYAPAEYRQFLEAEYRLAYRSYDWSLNEQR